MKPRFRAAGNRVEGAQRRGRVDWAGPVLLGAAAHGGERTWVEEVAEAIRHRSPGRRAFDAAGSRRCGEAAAVVWAAAALERRNEGWKDTRLVRTAAAIHARL